MLDHQSCIFRFTAKTSRFLC